MWFANFGQPLHSKWQANLRPFRYPRKQDADIPKRTTFVFTLCRNITPGCSMEPDEEGSHWGIRKTEAEAVAIRASNDNLNSILTHTCPLSANPVIALLSHIWELHYSRLTDAQESSDCLLIASSYARLLFRHSLTGQSHDMKRNLLVFTVYTKRCW